MSMSDTLLIGALRQQSWQRAKGELSAMLSTLAHTDSDKVQYRNLRERIETFIADVEDWGLYK